MIIILYGVFSYLLGIAITVFMYKSHEDNTLIRVLDGFIYKEEVSDTMAFKKINLNVEAAAVTIEEGGKKTVNNGQTKEIISKFLARMKTWTVEQLTEVLSRK